MNNITHEMQRPELPKSVRHIIYFVARVFVIAVGLSWYADHHAPKPAGTIDWLRVVFVMLCALLGDGIVRTAFWLWKKRARC